MSESAATIPGRRLDVSALTMRFGGLVALDDVSFEVEAGSIHALIGPNGAGKSTCFNVLSGVYRPTSGSVRFGDVELTQLPAHQVARQGVARTFQNLALALEHSVVDNILVGRHHLMSSGTTACALGLPSARTEERRHRERVLDIAHACGLDGVVDREVGTLSYGHRKRIELARAVAMEPSLLLLDEPVAGMNDSESRDMAGVILGLREHLGITVILVEHDMSMVMAIADHVTVLDFGRRIAGGTPDEVRSSAAVAEAYLGVTSQGTDDANEKGIGHGQVH